MKISVVISNRNDVAMLSVTVRSIIEELSPLDPSQSEIIICDNSDSHIYDYIASALPSKYIKERRLKIFRQDFPCLFTARETAISNASGDYILCLDSHMLCGHNMIVDLINFMDRRSDDPTLGFAHAPISWAHHHESRAKHDRDMSENETGPWGSSYDYERTITWKGMPWICRRSLWSSIGGYGALSEHRLSWGGGDILIGIKPWLLGYKNWAVPCRPGIHIGPFPKNPYGNSKPKFEHTINGERYRLYGNSGNGPHTIGFLVAFYVLGGEAMMKRNAKQLEEKFSPYMKVEEWWHKAMEYGANEKKWLDERKKMTFDELIKRKPWDD